MMECWLEPPHTRASFSEILDLIEEIVQTADTSDALEIDGFYLNIVRPEKQAEEEEEERRRQRIHSTDSFA